MTDKREMIEKLKEMPGKYDTGSELKKDTEKFCEELKKRNCCIRLSRPKRITVAIAIGSALIVFIAFSLGAQIAHYNYIRNQENAAQAVLSDKEETLLAE